MVQNPLIEIAKIISNGDAAVLADVTLCVRDPKTYFETHRGQYQERWIESAEDPELISWLGMVDALAAREYVCERDWKDEKEDFLYFLGNLAGMKRLNLDLQPDWLDEDGNIDEWCAVLDEKWMPRECRVGCVSIDSDSYVVFPASCAELMRLRTLSEKTRWRIG